jgi:prophage tail gpP-like protein
MGRNFTIKTEHSANNKTAKNRAIWEVNYRRAKGAEYQAVVSEWTAPTGEVWMPNKLVKVKDDIADINSYMLISSVKYALSKDTGRKTEMTLCTKDAFNLEAQIKAAEAKSNLLGKNFYGKN